MYFVKNRFYYHDCKSSCIYNVMKTHCCSCNNHDFICCISKLSLRSDVCVQTDF